MGRAPWTARRPESASGSGTKASRAVQGDRPTERLAESTNITSTVCGQLPQFRASWKLLRHRHPRSDPRRLVSTGARGLGSSRCASEMSDIANWYLAAPSRASIIDQRCRTRNQLAPRKSSPKRPFKLSPRPFRVGLRTQTAADSVPLPGPLQQRNPLALKQYCDRFPITG